MRIFFIVLICWLISSDLLADENNVPLFVDIYNKINSNSSANLAEEGKVATNLVLRDIYSRDIIKEKIFSYRVDKSSRSIRVIIPTGQYQLDEIDSAFGQNVYCEWGGATTGFDVREYLGYPANIEDIIVKTIWSCGSLGCSYDLTFGNSEKLDLFCKEP